MKVSIIHWQSLRADALKLLPWRDPFFGKLMAGQRPFRGGKYPLSDQPGWGWSFDTDYLEYARRKD